MLKYNVSYDSEILSNAETSAKGRIRYSDFLVATLNRRLVLNESILWAGFKYFENDNSSKISVHNFFAAFNRAGVVMSKEEISKIMKEEGFSYNKKFDFAEFKKILIRNL